MPTVTTNGIQTSYETRGDGPPIVFVHGAGNDHNYWTHQMDALEDDYRVVAYDLRDHGQTDPSSHEYRIEPLVQDLQALIESRHRTTDESLDDALSRGSRLVS